MVSGLASDGTLRPPTWATKLLDAFKPWGPVGSTSRASPASTTPRTKRPAAPGRAGRGPRQAPGPAAKRRASAPASPESEDRGDQKHVDRDHQQRGDRDRDPVRRADVVGVRRVTGPRAEDRRLREESRTPPGPTRGEAEAKQTRRGVVRAPRREHHNPGWRATGRRVRYSGAKARPLGGRSPAGNCLTESARSGARRAATPACAAALLVGTRGSQASSSRAFAADTVPRRSRKVTARAVKAGGLPRSFARPPPPPASSSTGRGSRRPRGRRRIAPAG